MSQKFPFDHFLKVNNKNSTPAIEKVVINPKNDFDNESFSNNFLLKDGSKIIDSFSSDELSNINSEVLKHIKESVTPQKFVAYFENNFFLNKVSEDYFEFSVSTPFIRTIIESYYLDNIKDALYLILGKKFNVSIVIENTGGSNKSYSSNKQNILNSLVKSVDFESKNSLNKIDNKKESKENKSANDAKFSLDLDLIPTNDDLESRVESSYINHVNPLSSVISIDPKKTFNCFVVGPSNNMAYATAKAVAKAPGKAGKYPSLYIYSDSGLGKTHLLHAVANEIIETFPALVVCLITARDFMKEMINAMQANNIAEFQKKYSEKIDVLMIDDIHELKNKKGTQNEFFHVFNELYNKGKQLIFTSDKPPKEIDGIEERIITRLQWGLVIDIQRPDIETRIAILKKKAKELDLYLTDDVLNLIAGSVKNSIRELEGSLIKLSAFSEVMNVEIDNEMVRNLLVLKNSESDDKNSMENIAKATSHYFKIPVADLKSKSRNKDIAIARHIAMYLSQKIGGATLQEVGKFYGNRDHTSVIHAIRKIQQMLKEDQALSRDVFFIESNL